MSHPTERRECLFAEKKPFVLSFERKCFREEFFNLIFSNCSSNCWIRCSFVRRSCSHRFNLLRMMFISSSLIRHCSSWKNGCESTNLPDIGKALRRDTGWGTNGGKWGRSCWNEIPRAKTFLSRLHRNYYFFTSRKSRRFQLALTNIQCANIQLKGIKK